VELGFTLWCNLTNEDIAGVNLGTDADDTAVVQLFEGILADVWNVAGDLFRSELGVTRFDLVLLDVDGGVDVVADHAFVQKNRVLVVVAFPGHKADQRVFTQRDLAVAGRRTICQYLTDADAFAGADDWTLIEAGALVGAQEFDDMEVFQLTVVGADHDLGCIDALNDAVDVGNDADA